MKKIAFKKSFTSRIVVKKLVKRSADNSKAVRVAKLGYGTLLLSGRSDISDTHLYIYAAEPELGEAGIRINMGRKSDSDTNIKTAIDLCGGGIAGFRVLTAVITQSYASSNPYRLSTYYNVYAAAAACVMTLPDLGTNPCYDGQVFIVKNLAGDNAVQVLAQGNNCIQYEATYGQSYNVPRKGDSAMFVFSMQLSVTANGTTYKGVWFACPMSRGYAGN